MANNPIDETLARYAQMQAQISAPTGVAGMQHAAYGQVQGGYLSAQQVAMSGALPGYASPGMMTPASMGVFRPSMGTPPPPVYVNPGVTSQFADAYEMSLMAQQQALSAFSDPASARTAYGRMSVNRFGAKYGEAIGTAAGAVLGGFGGAGWGGLAGGMFGGSLGNIPVVGDAMSWVSGLINQRAAGQLYGGQNLMANTSGFVNMGRQDIGMGGRGMSFGAATRLAGQFGNMAEASQGGFNTNDLLNVTQTAAETGLLSGASNIEDISKQVSKIMGLIGSIARLTGDPNFRNNIRAIAEMSRSGFALEDIPDVMFNMNMSARMAGMTRGEAGVYGQQGAALFNRAGLASGLGQQVGVHGAAMANLSMGAFSPIQANLLGGREGIAQRFTESSAAFMSGAANLLLPYLATEQEGGGLGISGSKLDALRGGSINMQQIIGQGAANAANPRFQQQLIIHQQELLSELGQKLGPLGIQGMQFSMAQGLSQSMGVPLETAAVMIAGGDPLQGSMLFKAWTDPKFQEGYRAQIDKQRERVQFGADQLSTARRESEPGWFSRNVFGPAGDWLANDPKLRGLGPAYRGWQDDKAMEEARGVQRSQDAMFNIEKVYAPNWAVSKEISDVSRRRGTAAPWEGRASQSEFSVAASSGMFSGLAGGSGDIAGIHGTGAIMSGLISGGDSPLARLGQWGMEKMYESSGELSMFEKMIPGIEDDPRIRKRLAETPGTSLYKRTQEKRGMSTLARHRSKATSRSAQDYQRMGGESAESWFRGLQFATGVIGDKPMRLIEMTVMRKAKELAQNGLDADLDTIMAEVENVFSALSDGPEMFQKNKNMIRSIAAGLLQRSGDPEIKRAVDRVTDKAGVLRRVYNVKEAQEAINELEKKFKVSLDTYGIGGEGYAAQSEKMLSLMNAEDDVRTAAIMMDQSQQDAIGAGFSPAVLAKASELKSKLGGLSGISEYLKGKGVTSREGISGALKSGLEGRGALSGLSAISDLTGIRERTEGKLGTIDPSKAGALDPQAAKQMANLDKEERVIQQMETVVRRVDNMLDRMHVPQAPPPEDKPK